MSPVGAVLAWGQYQRADGDDVIHDQDRATTLAVVVGAPGRNHRGIHGWGIQYRRHPLAGSKRSWSLDVGRATLELASVDVGYWLRFFLVRVRGHGTFWGTRDRRELAAPTRAAGDLRATALTRPRRSHSSSPAGANQQCWCGDCYLRVRDDSLRDVLNGRRNFRQCRDDVLRGS